MSVSYVLFMLWIIKTSNLYIELVFILENTWHNTSDIFSTMSLIIINVLLTKNVYNTLINKVQLYLNKVKEKKQA